MYVFVNVSPPSLYSIFTYSPFCGATDIIFMLMVLCVLLSLCFWFVLVLVFRLFDRRKYEKSSAIDKQSHVKFFRNLLDPVVKALCYIGSNPYFSTHFSPFAICFNVVHCVLLFGVQTQNRLLAISFNCLLCNSSHTLDVSTSFTQQSAEF